jgi:hypothetical protein
LSALIENPVVEHWQAQGLLPAESGKKPRGQKEGMQFNLVESHTTGCLAGDCPRFAPQSDLLGEISSKIP